MSSAIECKRCDCVFIPGGREVTDICAGCYKEKMEKAVLNRTQSQKSTKRVQEISETLIAVQKLEYHDRNFLCNTKSCCSMQIEYLQEIVRICGIDGGR